MRERPTLSTTKPRVMLLRQRQRVLLARARTAVAKISLAWRLAIVSLGLLVCLMAALGTVTVLFEQHAMYANQAESLWNEARVANHPGNAVNLLRLESPNTGVALYTPTGELIPSPPPNGVPVLVPPLVTSAQVRDAVNTNHNRAWYLVAQNAAGQSQLVTLIPVVYNGAPVAVLEVSTPTWPIDHAVAATRLMLLLGVLFALAIGALLTPLLVRAALKPLREMERTTSLISAGDLSLRLVEPPTEDEIGVLSRSFNSMVARLEAAFARQKRFVADVSHELRTPLTALGGGMEMLLIGAEAGDPDTGRRLMRGMYAEVERMRRLVEDLLTLARLDDGHLPMRIEPLDPGALMSGVSEQAERLARGQTIQCEIAPALPRIAADADRIRQVLLNLVDNALKFTPAPGAVTLRARRDGPTSIILEVEDTGVGIPPEALPHVFERFYRADFARARAPGQVGGSGLGLAIAKSLVEACGGNMAISSTLGKGTRVMLRFPAALALPTGPAPALSDSAPTSTSAPLRVS